jgi:long-subunit acyl-CoA synthetase (AMP-forming)
LLFYFIYFIIYYLFLFLQDVKLLLEDIAELKPSIFCAVPRVLDRIYSGELSLLAERANEFGLSVSFCPCGNQGF